jgi:arylsulfatase A-like enzyme
MLRADTPNLRKLMRRGSFTMWAKTTPQSITLPSHVSMLTGVSPNVHGIEWNADIPLAHAVYPNRPTLFELAKAAGYSTAMVTGKSKFNMLTPPQTLDHSWISPGEKCEDTDVLEHAVPMIRNSKPDVLFIHFPTVDSVGHGAGWGTPQQLAAIANADTCVGKVIDAIDEIGRTNSTLIIISSDHGGAGRTHGPDDPRSRSIPWIAAGPGVRADYDLTRFGKDFDVQTYDTFATACYVLGIQPRTRIEGKPIREMFDDAELTRPEPNKPRTPATQVH